MRVTVCIITRNQPEMVREAIRSVFAQTYRDFELVVVDDASDDGLTPAAINDELMGSGIPRRWRSLRTQVGPGAARNRGFANSASEFLLPLDGDDKIVPDALEKFVGAIGDRDLCFSQYRFFGDMDGVVETGPWGPNLTQRNAVPCCTLIRRSAFEKVGGYDESIPFIEDYDLWRMLYADGCTAAQIFEPLLLYRRHPGQWSAAQPGRPEAEKRLRAKWETPLEYVRGDA